MAPAKMWTSKLGARYPRGQIEAQDGASQAELKRLRGLREAGNHLCADCGAQDSSWASVSLGVFLCVTCSDVHRSVGTHVSKVKGCTGTYLWGPDEIDRMRAEGNRRAAEHYGDVKVSPDASKEEKQRHLLWKYQLPAVPSAPPASRALAVGAAPPSGTPACAGLGTLPVKAAPPQRAAMAQAVPQQCQSAGSSPKRPMALIASIPDKIFEDLFGEASAELPSAAAPPVQKQERAFCQSMAAEMGFDLEDLLGPPQ